MTGQPGQQQGEAPPQYSPDGRWWWDGRQWTPVHQEAARVQSPWRWDGRRWISLDDRFWWDGTTWQPVEVLPRRAQGGAGQMWYRRLWPTSPRLRRRIVVGSQVRGGDARTYRVSGAGIVGGRRRYYAYGSDGNYYWLSDRGICISGGELCTHAEPQRAGPPDADGKPSDCAASDWITGPGEYTLYDGGANWAPDATIEGTSGSADFSSSDSGSTWSDSSGSSDSGSSSDSGGGGSSD
ncbi:MAG TPA: hypothetical protein VKF14_20800 [Candidatus Dormibacteraeota bacterium]|nr:hypothetical protein [Candidatus Dormibacteraeota bacterium]